jgi:hypothetical protein
MPSRRVQWFGRCHDRCSTNFTNDLSIPDTFSDISFFSSTKSGTHVVENIKTQRMCAAAWSPYGRLCPLNFLMREEALQSQALRFDFVIA